MHSFTLAGLQEQPAVYCDQSLRKEANKEKRKRLICSKFICKKYNSLQPPNIKGGYNIPSISSTLRFLYEILAPKPKRN
jgi:hypothetical protein